MIKQYILNISIIFFAFGWYFDVHAQDLKFDNLVLISGVDKQVGAVYRQTLAAPGIDATITIVDLTGGTTLQNFDVNGSGQIDAFQPTVTKSTTLTEEYARFQFDFFDTGTSTPKNVLNAEINAVDVDGCCGLYEYSIYHGADSYTVETPTLLTVVEDPNGVRFQGPYGGPSGIDYSRTDYIAKVKYNSTESFTIDIGSNGNSSFMHRQASIYFKEITFSNPETTFTTGGQINFDGIDDYVEVPTSVLNSLGEFTLSFWIKPESLPAVGEYFHVIGQKDRYDINIHLSGGIARLWSRHTYNSGSSSQSISSNPITTDDWVHFAFVVNYTTNIVRVYQNGVHVSTGGTSGGAPDVNANPFRMGSKENSQPSVGDNFNGWLDEVRIFDISLTKDQIQRMVYQEIENKNGNVHGSLLNKDIVDIDSGTTIPWSNLVAYYPLNNIIGNITNDESQNSNNGSLYNMTSLLPQTAPMPYLTVTDGPWTTQGTWLHGDVWDIEDIPNNKDWSIVQISDNVSSSSSHTQLGMFLDSGKSLSVTGDNEINNTWYLQLDGTLDLADDSQLIQTETSDLVTSATGKILRRQEGNTDVYWYNYWTSPVGTLGVTSLSDNNAATNNINNSPFNLDMIKDGTEVDLAFTSAFDEVGKISDQWLYSFQNGITYYDWATLTPSSTIAPGVGYTQKGTGNAGTEQQYIFEGKPNNGTILILADDVDGDSGNESQQDVTLTTTLIGNPYPSALDADEFIRDNIDFDNGGLNPIIQGTILLWEQWAGTSHWLTEYEGGYGYINLTETARAYQHPDIVIADPTNPDNRGIKTPTKFLPVGQAFFVEVVNDGDIEFNNGQRVFKQESLNESVFFRNGDSQTTESSTESRMDGMSILRLEFGVSSGASRSFVLGFSDYTTDGFDYGYDGGLITDPPADDMGSILNGQQYVIQAFAPITPEKEVALVMHSSSNFTHTLKSTEITNIPEGQDLFIRDNLTGASYDLRSTEPYNFTSEAGTFMDRFEVIFTDPTLSISDDILDTVVIFVDNSQDKLMVKGLDQDVKQMTLTNMLGQTVKAFNDIENNVLENGVHIGNLSSGVYLVNLITEDNLKLNKKIILE